MACQYVALASGSKRQGWSLTCLVFLQTIYSTSPYMWSTSMSEQAEALSIWLISSDSTTASMAGSQWESLKAWEWFSSSYQREMGRYSISPLHSTIMLGLSTPVPMV